MHILRDPVIIISDIVSKALTKATIVASDDNTIANPKEFNVCRTRVIGSCLGLCAFFRITALHPSETKVYCTEDAFRIIDQISCGTSKFVKCYEKLTDLERLYLNEEYQNFTTMDYRKFGLMGLYESLLSLQFIFENGRVLYKYDKTDRNKLGSYYTPDILADICVKYTLNKFIEERLGSKKYSECEWIAGNGSTYVKDLLTKTRFVDFSCGTGKFLVALSRYFSQVVLGNKLPDGRKRDALIDFTLNVHGIDVDYLALEIGKIELSLMSNDLGLLSKLDHNFKHGNPLIPGLLVSSPADRVRVFEEGLIHNKNLGLSLDMQHDVIVGNPPWEKIRFEEKNFFRSISNTISSITDKASRSEAIELKISKNEGLARYYNEVKDDIKYFKKFVKNAQTFRLTANGEPNTYSLFTELALNHRSKKGIIGLILKSAIVTSQVNKRLFSHLLDNNLLLSVFDFVNTKKIFDIDSRERFCFLLLGDRKSPKFTCSMGLTSPDQIFDKRYYQQIDRDLLKAINPITSMLPNVTNMIQMKTIRSIIEKNHMFNEVYPKAKFGRIVHLTNHSSSIHRVNSNAVLPIYEGKFIEQYDGRYSGFNGIEPRDRFGNKASSKVLSKEQKINPLFIPEARFYIEVAYWKKLTKGYRLNYSLIWRSLTSATNQRTCIATILPHMPTSQSIQLLQLSDNSQLAILLAVFNSLIFDYLVKAKLNGIDLTKTIITQIPVPPLRQYDKIVVYKGQQSSIGDHILTRVCALLSNDTRLEDFIKDVGKLKYARQIVDSGDRRIIQREIDLLIAKAYQINSEVFRIIISAFQKLPPELSSSLLEEELVFLDMP